MQRQTPSKFKTVCESCAGFATNIFQILRGRRVDDFYNLTVKIFFVVGNFSVSRNFRFVFVTVQKFAEMFDGGIFIFGNNFSDGVFINSGLRRVEINLFGRMSREQKFFKVGKVNIDAPTVNDNVMSCNYEVTTFAGSFRADDLHERFFLQVEPVRQNFFANFFRRVEFIFAPRQVGHRQRNFSVGYRLPVSRNIFQDNRRA